MKDRIAKLSRMMIEFDRETPDRVNHFLKVYGFAKSIGELEGLDQQTQFTLETAALVHDVGIKISRQKYGDGGWRHQEIEGPPVARKMLDELAFPPEMIERVCYLVAHHHTYNAVDGVDYQILLEADFLVNVFEKGMNRSQIVAIRDKNFCTKTGTEYINWLYLS